MEQLVRDAGTFGSEDHPAPFRHGRYGFVSVFLSYQMNGPLNSLFKLINGFKGYLLLACFILKLFFDQIEYILYWVQIRAPWGTAGNHWEQLGNRGGLYFFS